MIKDANLVEFSRVVMEKPFGTDLRERGRAQRGPARDLQRAADLPDRPLPGQGGGAEHPGLPVRQRAVRADLEPQLHRPHPDRHPRDPRSGQAGDVLRVDRGVQGHGGHPPVPGARLRGHGAADRAGAVRDQRGEEQGLPVAAADQPPRRGPGPVRRLPRTSPGSRRDSDTETFIALQCRHRQLALGRGAVLPADRQAAGRGPADHLDRLQGGAAQHVPGQLRGRFAGSRSPHLRPGRRVQGVAVVLRQATRAGDADGEAVHAVLHRRDLLRRATCWRRTSG